MGPVKESATSRGTGASARGEALLDEADGDPVGLSKRTVLLSSDWVFCSCGRDGPASGDWEGIGGAAGGATKSDCVEVVFRVRDCLAVFRGLGGRESVPDSEPLALLGPLLAGRSMNIDLGSFVTSGTVSFSVVLPGSSFDCRVTALNVKRW